MIIWIVTKEEFMSLSKEFEFYRGESWWLMTQTSTRSLASIRLITSVLQIANSEENYDKTEALTDATVREAAKAAEEKITEKVVESRVKQDPCISEGRSGAQHGKGAEGCV